MTISAADLAVRTALTDRAVLGLTVWGEARDQTTAGRIAVANVILHRRAARFWGPTISSVCLWPAQFSCWAAAGGAENYAAVMTEARALVQPACEESLLPASLRACLVIAEQAMTGVLPDLVPGATHYLTVALYETRPPRWVRALRETRRLGAHVFLGPLPIAAAV